MKTEIKEVREVQSLRKKIKTIDKKIALLISEKKQLFKNIDEKKKNIVDKFNKSIEVL